jgi:hypothetical protein
MLSRGRQSNHAYLETTGDGDPHNRLRPETISPPTPTERLEAILSRSDVPTSATTQIAELHDPRTLLGAAIACYQDAIVTAAEQYAGPRLVALLDETAERLLPGLSDADAWPVARSHLLVIGAEDINPLSALKYAINVDSLTDARDPAAVIDHRLDTVSLRFSTGRRPLPWLPSVPKAITDPEWGYYLGARYELVERLAADVRTNAEQAGHTPGWARALVEPPSPEIVAQIELWRAAHQVPDNDLRPTGPAQHHLVEARSQHRLDGLIAGEAESVLKWLGWIHEAAPTTVEDPATIRVARECAEVDPDGTWLRAHVQAAAGRSLPDDHKADALRYRLEPWLNEVWETVTPQPPRHDPRRDVHQHTPRHSPGISI